MAKMPNKYLTKLASMPDVKNTAKKAKSKVRKAFDFVLGERVYKAQRLVDKTRAKRDANRKVGKFDVARHQNKRLDKLYNLQSKTKLKTLKAQFGVGAAILTASALPTIIGDMNRTKKKKKNKNG